MRSGPLRERIRFEQRDEDANGDRLGPWVVDPAFEVAAGYTWLRGGEGVMQSRLTGVQPVVIRVRASAAIQQVTTDFRIVDLRSDQALNIRSKILDRRRGFIDFTCDTGGADG